MNILLKDWLDIVEYRITSGEDYCWKCYGNNTFILTFWNQLHGAEERSCEVVYDRFTQQVFEATVVSGTNNEDRLTAYRWFDENYRGEYKKECIQRNINDDGSIKYTDLELWEDFAEKAHAILNNYEYDTRISIPLNFSDEEFLELFKLAHEKDMTFNAFMEKGLKETLDQMLININENYDNAWPMSFNENNR